LAVDVCTIGSPWNCPVPVHSSTYLLSLDHRRCPPFRDLQRPSRVRMDLEMSHMSLIHPGGQNNGPIHRDVKIIEKYKCTTESTIPLYNHFSVSDPLQ
jgi:hypothetical protein